MKKIKRKPKSRLQKLPTYIIGYTGSGCPPPGFLAAWFNQEYGGPLSIQLSPSGDIVNFDAVHATWKAAVTGILSVDMRQAWKEQLGWDHETAAAVYPLSSQEAGGRISDCDVVLHVARIARGLSLLTEGTTYDLVMEQFLNPSDWQDHRLERFQLHDHVRVEQRERMEEGTMWFLTQGLAIFGIEELETFQPRGLPEQATIEALLEIAEVFIQRGKGLNVGESEQYNGINRVVKVLRHRTDRSLGKPVILREVVWE